MQPSQQHNFRIGLLATGNELTEGEILNTNGQVIVKSLTDLGLTIGLHVITPDSETDIANGLRFLFQSHSFIIIIGGLGPTSDDKTRYALSSVLNKPLEFDEASWQAIRERVKQRIGREPHAANRQQALFPQDSHIIANPNGTAAGCWIEHENKFIYMLPGPPHECLPMFEETVLPLLLSKQTQHKQIKKSWRLTGAVESEIAALIDEAVKPYPVITGYRAVYPYLEVKIYTVQHDQFDEMIAIITKIIEPFISEKEES